ncbi:plasma membrane calcium [Rhizoclosmatium sp. JEL0117]|nr:plasma membrane calcium [Rhizoclosmatium sp. JEL0117]
MSNTVTTTVAFGQAASTEELMRRQSSVSALVENGSGFGLTLQELSALVTPFKDHSKLSQLGGAIGILSKLRVDETNGLSIVNDKDLNARREAFGANVLPAVKPKSLFQYMISALSDKIMILLSVVSFISLSIGIYEDVHEPDPAQRVHWIEGFSVLVAVIIVVMASSINDLQKEKQFRKLNAKKEDRKVKGIRDSKTQLISVYDILVGDVLLLEPGDVIAADGVFISGMGLKCDESSATGETDAIRKGVGHDCLLVSGSKVTEGIGKYVVTGVGEHSFFGAIMMAMRTENEDTPLQVKLDGLAEQIAKLGTAFALLLFILLFLKYIITVLKTNGFGDGEHQESGPEVASQLVNILLVSIAIVAVAVPEGLPLAVTLALAYATTRMMKDNNLVRVLSACETMGNATTICSDKTGTLTQNRMTVVTGVVGKNAMFEGADEVKDLKGKMEAISGSASTEGVSTSSGEVLTGSSNNHGVSKQPGPVASVILEKIMEGVAINSSAFEGVDDTTGKASLIGSKTEIALLEWATHSGFDFKQIRSSNETLQVIQVYPFSSERKSMATLVKVTKPGMLPVYRMHVKGAPEIVMRYCDRVVLLPFHPSPTAIKNEIQRNSTEDGKTAKARKRSLSAIPAPGSRSNPHSSLIYPLDEKLKSDYTGIIESFALQSLRTICVAYREFTGEEFDTLVNGTLRDQVVAAKKAERQSQKEQMLSEMQEGVVRSNELLTAPNVVQTPSSPSHKPGDLTRISTISGGSSMLMIPNGNVETKSFVESQLSEEEVVTDSDVLSHPLALAQLAGQKLTLASIVGIEDPLRPGVIEAVKACQDAGVFVRMVTGDNIMTAKSIATKCGIYQRGGLVMEGEYFRGLTEERMLELIPKLQVLARSSPLDKQILVSKLKLLGETVAVTGDGTNDGPALKMADIGFSMGIAGTEVAKEASSIILMDDSFSSVVKAILWGRSVNDAVKKFLQFQLSVNISAVLITLISALVDSNESSALTVVQLLWVNLIMDTLAALALATELPTNELLQRPPEAKKAPLITFAMWKMIIGQAFLQIVVNLVLLFAGAYLLGFRELIDAGGIWGTDDGTKPKVTEQKLVLKTIVFNSFVILQLFSLINFLRGDKRGRDGAETGSGSNLGTANVHPSLAAITGQTSKGAH